MKRYFDRKIRDLFAPSGLFFHEVIKVEDLIQAGEKFVSPKFTGEAILTVGAALHEILHPACGIISIGPFGCMPSRVAEAVLSEKFTTAEKLDASDAYQRKQAALAIPRSAGEDQKTAVPGY